MIDKRFIFVFCLVFFANFKIIYTCSCEPFNIENVICKSNFSLLVIAKGVGPQSKTHDSYYVEIRYPNFILFILNKFKLISFFLKTKL